MGALRSRRDPDGSRPLARALHPTLRAGLRDGAGADRPYGALAEAIRAADEDGYRPRRALALDLIASLPWHVRPSADELVAYWQAAFPQCAAPGRSVVDTLDWLRARGLELGVVTNGGAAVQRAKIAALGVEARFATVVVSEDVGIEKPDAGIFRLALDRLGARPEATWFVGDHPVNDVFGAARAGMTSVWLRGRIAWWEGLAPPEHTIDALDELPALVAAASAQR